VIEEAQSAVASGIAHADLSTLAAQLHTSDETAVWSDVSIYSFCFGFVCQHLQRQL
jgi:hypothetical protein